MKCDGPLFEDTFVKELASIYVQTKPRPTSGNCIRSVYQTTALALALAAFTTGLVLAAMSSHTRAAGTNIVIGVKRKLGKAV
jgi:hypothetical protein